MDEDGDRVRNDALGAGGDVGDAAGGGRGAHGVVGDVVGVAVPGASAERAGGGVNVGEGDVGGGVDDAGGVGRIAAAVLAAGRVDATDLSLVEGDAGEARLKVERSELPDLHSGGLSVAIGGSHAVMAAGDRDAERKCKKDKKR
jgi:hypothetical protein